MLVLAVYHRNEPVSGRLWADALPREVRAQEIADELWKPATGSVTAEVQMMEPA